MHAAPTFAEAEACSTVQMLAALAVWAQVYTLNPQHRDKHSRGSTTIWELVHQHPNFQKCTESWARQKDFAKRRRLLLRLPHYGTSSNLLRDLGVHTVKSPEASSRELWTPQRSAQQHSLSGVCHCGGKACSRSCRRRSSCSRRLRGRCPSSC